MGRLSPMQMRIDIDEEDCWRFYNGAKATAFVRGNANIQFPMKFIRVEPYVIPKTSYTGETIERIDTRVLQVIYQFDQSDLPVFQGNYWMSILKRIHYLESGNEKDYLCFVSFLTGCMVGPNYKKPESPMPNHFTEEKDLLRFLPMKSLLHGGSNSEIPSSISSSTMQSKETSILKSP